MNGPRAFAECVALAVVCGLLCAGASLWVADGLNRRQPLPPWRHGVAFHLHQKDQGR